MAPRTARSERSCICGAILRASCAARLGPPCPARQQGKLAELAPPWRRLLLSIFMLQSASFCQNKFAYPTVRMRRRRNCRCLPARFSKLRIALGDLLLSDRRLRRSAALRARLLQKGKRMKGQGW